MVVMPVRVIVECRFSDGDCGNVRVLPAGWQGELDVETACRLIAAGWVAPLRQLTSEEAWRVASAPPPERDMRLEPAMHPAASAAVGERVTMSMVDLDSAYGPGSAGGALGAVPAGLDPAAMLAKMLPSGGR